MKYNPEKRTHILITESHYLTTTSRFFSVGDDED